MLSIWGILVARQSIKLSPTRTLEWIIGAVALKYIGDGRFTPVANNDNQEMAA